MTQHNRRQKKGAGERQTGEKEPDDTAVLLWLNGVPQSCAPKGRGFLRPYVLGFVVFNPSPFDRSKAETISFELQSSKKRLSPLPGNEGCETCEQIRTVHAFPPASSGSARRWTVTYRGGIKARPASRIPHPAGRLVRQVHYNRQSGKVLSKEDTVLQKKKVLCFPCGSETAWSTPIIIPFQTRKEVKFKIPRRSHIFCMYFVSERDFSPLFKGCSAGKSFLE